MPRRVQDIVPGDRRSIRNIPVKIDRVERPRPLVRRMPVTPPVTPRVRRPRSRRAPLLWGIMGAVVILAGIAFVASAHYARATFTIVPRSVPVSVDGTYTFQASSASSGGASGAASYSLISMSGSASTTVAAVSGPAVSTKAQGTVTIYNSYTSSAQRLVAGTRMADDSGLVYRLTSSVTVPGLRSSGGSSIPGSVSATIVADQPGSQYDISESDDVSDFKMIAYQGTARYSTIYARLSSDVSGGFIGVKTVVTPSLLASTTALLRDQVTEALLAKLEATVPSGSIMYPTGYASVFSAPVVSDAATTTALVSVQGTVYGIIFDQTSLISLLGGPDAVSPFNGFAYDAPGLASLSFAISNPNDFSPTAKSSLIAHIQGSLKIVGIIPVDQLKQKFAGVSLGDTQAILKPYAPVVESGSGELTPPWAHVPSDPSRISIVVQQP